MAKFVIAICFLTLALMASCCSACLACSGGGLYKDAYIAPGGCGLGAYAEVGAYKNPYGYGLPGYGLGGCGLRSCGLGKFNKCAQLNPCLPGPIGALSPYGCCLDSAKVCLAQKLLCLKKKLLAKKLGVCGGYFL